MPSGSYRQVYVRCPFYKSDDGKSKIICEGIVDESRLTISFGRRDDYETQITVFCSEHYRKCELYRIIKEKYDDE